MPDPDEDIIELYHNHAICEQFHSEIKTDMDMERMPSGKFDTNALILKLGMIAYNVLRIISTEAMKKNDMPVRHKTPQDTDCDRTAYADRRTSDNPRQKNFIGTWEKQFLGECFSQNMARIVRRLIFLIRLFEGISMPFWL